MISILNLTFSVSYDIVKLCAPGTQSKLGAILQRITSLTEVWILSIKQTFSVSYDNVPVRSVFGTPSNLELILHHQLQK